MTDDEVLSVLSKMEQEQKFFDQMHASWVYIKEVITRFREIQTNIPVLIAEESRLRESIANLGIDHQGQKNKIRQSLQTEHDNLSRSLKEKIEPAQNILKEIEQKIVNAEERASRIEAECVERVTIATAAAVEAESRLASVSADFAALAQKVNA